MPGEPDRRVARDPLVVDHAERLAGLGAWDWMPATGVLEWSDNLFRLYGLEVGEIVPSPEWVVERVHPGDLERVRTTLDALSAGDPRSVEYRFRRDDGETVLLRATVAVLGDSEAGGPRILGVVQDLTDQRRLEREIAARLAVTDALERWRSVDDGATDLLEALGRVLGFAYGALWVKDDQLTLKATWHDPSAALERVSAATVRWHPGPGSPTIGRAFSTGQPVVTTDLSASAARDRVLAMRDAGIEAALAVPARFEQETVAVLELLSTEPVVLTDRLARALYGIGHEIGHFLAGRRGELVSGTLTPRAVEVLQLAARGAGAEAIAAELGVSLATVKRHFERAYMQLGVSGRPAAVAEAMRRGIVS